MIALDFVNGAGDIRRPPPLRLIEQRDDLETAVAISLFTDARDELRPVGDRQGWWAGPMGSLLWTLFPSKQTETTRALAEQYSAGALAWMVTEGVAASVDVVATYTARGVLALGITIAKPGGEKVAYAYELNWAAQARRSVPNGVE